MPYETKENAAVCRFVRCLVFGPRCSYGYCAQHCREQHEYWRDHIMADGKPGRWPSPAAPTESTQPEPGKLEELADDSEVFVSVPNTTRYNGTTEPGPIRYIA